ICSSCPMLRLMEGSLYRWRLISQRRSGACATLPAAASQSRRTAGATRRVSPAAPCSDGRPRGRGGPHPRTVGRGRTARPTEQRATLTPRGRIRQGRDTMDAFELSDLDRQRAEAGKLYLEFLRTPALSLGLYVLPAGGVDAQQPHKEEEVYYVVSG